jgi:hypothetical protein
MSPGFADVNLDEVKNLCKARFDKGEIDEEPLNFVQISDVLTVKIAGIWGANQLDVKYAWLNHLVPLVDDTKVVIPRPWGPPIKHGNMTLLLMDNIPGMTVAQYLQTKNGKLDDRTSITYAMHILLCAQSSPKAMRFFLESPG